METAVPVLEYKLLHPLARELVRSKDESVGYDLHACIDAPISLRFGENAQMIPVGLALEVPVGLAALILPRNWLAHRSGLVLGNTVGVMDAMSHNQWQVSAWNRGPVDEIVIRPGDAFAQVLFVPVVFPGFKPVTEFSAGA